MWFDNHRQQGVSPTFDTILNSIREYTSVAYLTRRGATVYGKEILTQREKGVKKSHKHPAHVNC